MEREVYDMFGIMFAGHPDLRRILMPDEFDGLSAAQGLPAARARRTAQFPVITRRGSLGADPCPSSPRKHNMPTCRYARDERARTTSGRSTSARSTRPRTPRCASSSRSTARRIVKAVPDIGYLHSGFEKLGEHLDYNQYVTLIDRMNYISPVANEVAWHQRGREAAGHRD